jgi:hypothetical protein
VRFVVGRLIKSTVHKWGPHSPCTLTFSAQLFVLQCIPISRPLSRTYLLTGGATTVAPLVFPRGDEVAIRRVCIGYRSLYRLRSTLRA